VQLAMSFSYPECKAFINAATRTNYHVHPLAVNAFQKSITAAALAIIWLMQKPLTGPNAVIDEKSKQKILQMLSAINEPHEFYQIDFIDRSFVEQTDDFMVFSHESAELKCFAEHLCLTKPMYCYWFVNLVNLTMECNQLMVNYNQRVSKPTVFAVLFGYNEIVIGIV